MNTPSLNDREKQIVKRLIADGEKNQDVHHLINIGRKPTVNFGRLSGSADWPIIPATDDEIARYKYEKSLVDLRTGLSPIGDERLYKSREAMISAVQLFNNPSLIFKIEIFAILSQIAWTYLLHEFYLRRGNKIISENGNSLLLSQMIEREDCPLSLDVKKNLIATKTLRDEAEHKILNSVGRKFWVIFQSNCLNFDHAIRELFGDNLGLQNDLAVSLQFGKMSIGQLSQIHKYDISPEIEAIDSAVSIAANETGNEGISYKFKVNYTFEKASKGEANIVFTDNNKQSSNISNVLTKNVVGDDIWPFKVGEVIKQVKNLTQSNFNSHHHMLAWKKYGARPRTGSQNPADCKKDWCHYHKAHKDYTYSKDWIEFLINIVNNPEDFEKLKMFKPNK